MVATHQKSVAAQDVCRQPTGDKAIPTSHPPRPATLTRPASFLSATRAPRGRCHSPDPRILAGAPAWSVPTLEYKPAGLSSGAKASARAPSARQAKLRPAATIGCRVALQGRAVQWNGRLSRMQDAVGFWGASIRVHFEALGSAGETRSKGKSQGGRALANTCFRVAWDQRPRSLSPTPPGLCQGREPLCDQVQHKQAHRGEARQGHMTDFCLTQPYSVPSPVI